MKTFTLKIVLISPIVCLVNCVPCLIKDSQTIQKIDKSTERVTTVDQLIQKYEKEHQIFYEEKIGDGDNLPWPALNKKDISHYCRLFLQNTFPLRQAKNVTGVANRNLLHYKKENPNLTSTIVIVHCKIMSNHPRYYYITRAPEPNCVYSINRTHKGAGSIFTIKNKYCDFEEISLKRKRKEIIGDVHKPMGKPIAEDKYLLDYELEHQELLKREGVDGDNLPWPALNQKDVSNYCRQFLQYSFPRRQTENVTGVANKNVLHYKKDNSGFTSTIVIVHCKIMSNHPRYYYITRAPDPNCVYCINRTHKRAGSIFTIINKCCDFEEFSLKQKREEIISDVHKPTGQPIAKDKYLLEYELEHQELLKSEGVDGKRIHWPYAMQHKSLDSYCHQYLGECFPRRTRKGVTGSWDTDILNYQKLNFNEDIEVTTVICRAPNSTKCNYYITRAPDENCVYALFRNGCNSSSTLVIGFKHCDFEERKELKIHVKRFGYN